MQSTGQLPVIGLDIAKNVFQLHSVDAATGEIQRRQLKRPKVAEFFANRQPSLVAIEACGGAHHWARTLLAMGHKVKLLPAKHVRAFVLRDKTDALDAQAIWIAAQQPHIKDVSVKSEQQQACLALHSMRQQLMKMRIMQTNALRGLLYEFGATFAKGDKALFSEIESALEALSSALPQVVVDSLREQVNRIKVLEADMVNIETRLKLQLKQDPQMQRIAKIPGVGLLTATAAIATMGEASAFKSGREFCAWLGLVPSQNGTGGKVRLGSISKRGDTYLRTLLVNGARGVVHNVRRPGPWLDGLKVRRHSNIVCVAQAAKMARMIWALTAKEQEYQSDHKSVRPQMS